MREMEKGGRRGGGEGGGRGGEGAGDRAKRRASCTPTEGEGLSRLGGQAIGYARLKPESGRA